MDIGQSLGKRCEPKGREIIQAEASPDPICVRSRIPPKCRMDALPGLSQAPGLTKIYPPVRCPDAADLSAGRAGQRHRKAILSADFGKNPAVLSFTPLPWKSNGVQ